MIEERRKYIRLDAKIEFTYKIEGGTGLEEKTITKNISPGGVRGWLDNHIKKGDRLELNINIPTLKNRISAIGKVVWTAGEESGKIDAGIKFEEIDPEMKNGFLGYICELMSPELKKLLKEDYAFI